MSTLRGGFDRGPGGSAEATAGAQYAAMAQAAMELARAWAQATSFVEPDPEQYPGRYSAYHYAMQAAGGQWFRGPGVPSALLGEDGNYYLDEVTGDLYQKVTGIWVLVLNIKGPAGPEGPPGTGGGGATSLDGLTDVIITTPATDQVLKYNGVNWVNGTGGAAADEPFETVTYGATTTIDCTAGHNFRCVLTGNVSTLTLSSPVDGQSIVVLFVQDGTGGRTVAWPASFVWAGHAAPVLTTTANAIDVLVGTYSSTDSKWIVSLSKQDSVSASTITRHIQLACSDETTALTAGTGKITFRMPHAMTLTGVRASLTTAQTSGNIFTVDINENGTSILSTKLTIDNTEKTSTTAATPAVISDVSLADDAEITVDIDQVGDGTAKGLKITLIGS